MSAGLLGLHARLPVSPAVLLEAAALHLDVADEHSPSAMQAWTALADTLSRAANVLCNLQVSSVCLALCCRLCKQTALRLPLLINRRHRFKDV